MNKCISNLAKVGLIAKVKNAKCEWEKRARFQQQIKTDVSGQMMVTGSHMVASTT